MDSGPLSRASSGAGASAGANASEPFQISELLSAPKPSAQGDDSAEYDRHAAALHGAKADEYDDDGRVLFQKSELRAHTGAVYTAKFSPCGRLLASGSLDTKVLLWDVTTKFNQQQLASLAHHAQLVIDVSWSDDSKSLVSASYDHTVKLWDVEKSQLNHSSEVPGLIQCVSFNLADSNQYFFGTSKGCIHQVDARADVVRTWQNDAMVNSLNVSPDGQFVITGDSKGMIKTWDVRMDSCIEDISKLNDAGHHAISHLHASPPVDGRRSGDEDGRFLAVNSYDNMLRVYDRRSKLISSSHGQEQMQLAFFVTGHKNKNWPIKSSFFRGEGYKYKLNLPSNRHTQRKLTDGDGEDFQDTYVGLSLHFWLKVLVQCLTNMLWVVGCRDRPDAAQETLLLATGSADNKIYLHDVSLKHPNARPSPYLVQKIDAHSDRVYCVDFHPTEPILASASADYSVKIWLPRAPNTRLPKPKS
uniref:Anaphase-promoting complex subunit 4 WD40 domain-containing protein n=1 Tax=Globisporangium ultimum (strain ATCC 200006 / CBS 805.95 / DAOM BR144) TaxID=431595 RepID=K3X6P5_GLOUD